jgi:fidgetin-like protein 1
VNLLRFKVSAYPNNRDSVVPNLHELIPSIPVSPPSWSLNYSQLVSENVIRSSSSGARGLSAPLNARQLPEPVVASSNSATSVLAGVKRPPISSVSSGVVGPPFKRAVAGPASSGPPLKPQKTNDVVSVDESDSLPSGAPSFRTGNNRIVKPGLSPNLRMNSSVAAPSKAVATSVAAVGMNTRGGNFHKSSTSNSNSNSHMQNGQTSNGSSSSDDPEKSWILEQYGETNQELRACDPKHIKSIENDLLTSVEKTTFESIAGLHDVKEVMNEAVVFPMIRRDLFTNLTAQPKGVLLFGPPGTGKTLIGKAVASECGARFFAISASSITSKWIGEGEKLVKTLFVVARALQPSIIFIDEVDSLLTSRNDSEHDSSRRIKTEFFIQLDGASTKKDDFVLIIGTTNRPQEIDEAARRRFTKRIYVPLPDSESRLALLQYLVKTEEKIALQESDLHQIVNLTDGFSGADMHILCQEAARLRLRQAIEKATVRANGNKLEAMRIVDKEIDYAPLSLDHFRSALVSTRPSVAPSELLHYIEWNQKFGIKQ